MAFTRDDNNKTKLNVERANESLSYMLNVPGNGTHPEFIADPQIRLQGFAANISTNIVDINSMLLGVNKQLDRDCSIQNTRDNNFNDTYKLYNFPVKTSAITDQPRTINPAWQIRDLEQSNWNYLHTNPQQNTEILFENNINARMAEKDIYTANCQM